MKIDRNGEVTIGPFPNGMNNRVQAHSLPEGTARNIVNSDINSSGKGKRRRGSTKVYSGLNTRGGYSCPLGMYFVEGPSLKMLLDYGTLSSSGEQLVSETETLIYSQDI